jgi:hypothetical protein
MSDMIDIHRGIGDHYKRLRAAYGVKCTQCPIERPKTNPSVLLPGQRCKVDGYRDPRPELTDEQWGAV